MSIFGFYFVSGLLREAGWPRKQGFFKKEVIDTTILDAAIDQMVDWAAAIGAGRPMLAMQSIAEMFRDRDWSGDKAPSIKQFIENVRRENEFWSGAKAVAPREVVKPTRFSAAGSTIEAKALADQRLRLGLEQWFLEGVLWGFANPVSFEEWYKSRSEEQSERLTLMQESGLKVDRLSDLRQYLDECEGILRNYERDIGSLSAVPERLLAEGRSLGRQV